MDTCCTDHKNIGLRQQDAILKRSFDLIISSLFLVCTGWIILTAWILATIDTQRNGFFRQNRVGRNGCLFEVIKIRSMTEVNGVSGTITTEGDLRITKFGKLLRKTKIDELPQFFNVFKGEMSLVGPRPDVPGYADNLEGKDRIILTVRPGVTGPASIKYRHEENLLATQYDPVWYNNNILWPDKVRLNRQYVENWSFKKDLQYIWTTIFN